ncbi:type I pantothenate kinase [Pseudoroseomonas cervicalis]|uniref:type I pantothenate kinase n=1 Tax=Teichococcus cervicalis TaxID=204525 RepID=UPI002780B058|nr:type I pantothenate kinase [Pseudoroseomonas cervicalis]MDQ1081178.1 type I pantothenate kinase [Pseudoroseomonas cervicalis]
MSPASLPALPDAPAPSLRKRRAAAGPQAYRIFPRAEWAALRANTPLSLSAEDLEGLRGLTDRLSLDEVAEIFLPLSRLLNLQVAAARGLGVVQDTFLGRQVAPPPYIIGIAGSVAVGKSTFARVLQAILARWPDHPSVALVTTDGFLYPTRELEARGLMQRKGFPESYDLRRMIAFLSAVKAGEAEVGAPVYSHLTYDIIPGQKQVVRRPDILIFEGLNVLQAAPGAPLLASDFFDFSVYVDAAEADIAEWYVQRFLLLQRTAFQQPRSYFHRYKDLPEAEAVAVAQRIWREINLRNLHENILPTRERARLVLRKGAGHAVEEIWLRRM